MQCKINLKPFRIQFFVEVVGVAFSLFINVKYRRQSVTKLQCLLFSRVISEKLSRAKLAINVAGLLPHSIVTKTAIDARIKDKENVDKTDDPTESLPKDSEPADSKASLPESNLSPFDASVSLFANSLEHKLSAGAFTATSSSSASKSLEASGDAKSSLLPSLTKVRLVFPLTLHLYFNFQKIIVSLLMYFPHSKSIVYF